VKKNILILVSSIVLFSLFNTIETNFKLWNNPTINTNHIITPDIPISFDTDISLFGLFINFFSDLELNNTTISNDEIINITSNADSIDDILDEEMIPITTRQEEKPPLPPPPPEVIEIVEELIEEEVIEEVIPEVVEEVIPEVVEKVIPEVVEKEIPLRGTEEERKKLLAVQNAAKNKQPVQGPPIVNTPIEEEVYIKSDEEIIRDNPQIKDNAKELLLESLKNGIISMEDIEGLLSKHAGETIKKRYVKKLIKSKKK
jgi:hypothetical protein